MPHASTSGKHCARGMQTAVAFIHLQALISHSPSPVQVATVCKHLAQTPELAGGFNAVGFSQGGQFIRAVLERCQHTGPRMHTLITLGGQHQGIMSVPTCWSPGTGYAPSALCKSMQHLLGFGAYLPWVRDHIVQAQYFKVSRLGISQGL